tara:strand:- start:101 stop:478 length:378 start_codon:yes stop_codon:yes gene_type:complete
MKNEDKFWLYVGDSSTIDIQMMVGKLAYEDTDYGDVLSIDQCKRGVDRLGVKWSEIQSNCRERRIVDARRLCCGHLRNKGWTFKRIATAVGYTDHATAHYHVRMSEQLIDIDPIYKQKHLKFIQA